MQTSQLFIIIYYLPRYL